MAKHRRNKSRRRSSSRSRHPKRGLLKRLERSIDKMGASVKYGGVSFRAARKQLGRGGRPRKGGLPPQLRGAGPVGTVLKAVGLKPRRTTAALIKLVGGYASPEQLSDGVESGALTREEAHRLDAYFQKRRNHSANAAALMNRKARLGHTKGSGAKRGRRRGPNGRFVKG